VLVSLFEGDTPSLVEITTANRQLKPNL
jgi:hypothetical protein